MQAKINGAYVTTTPSVKVGGVYKPITNTFVKINGVYKDAGYLQKCYAYNFDGIDDRGQLALRAIDPDGDNTFEFWSPPSLVSAQTVISQNVNPTTSAREFQLFISNNALNLTLGGINTVIFSNADGLLPSSRYGLIISAGNYEVRDGGVGGLLMKSGTFTRGAAREPSAQTLIGCRGNGAGVFTTFTQGPQYDIKINGTLWPMADRNQAIQPSIPAGNNMTLVNTTSDRWEEVACNLRVTP